jgi:hypothetical protein
LNKLSTEENQRRLEFYQRGYTDAEIGIRCGISRGGIKGWRDQLGLAANSKGRLPHFKPHSKISRKQFFKLFSEV